MLTSKQRINKILNKEEADRVGLWIGNPTDETKRNYCDYYNIAYGVNRVDHGSEGEACIIRTDLTVDQDIELALKSNSDIVWVCPDVDRNTWQHPEGKPIFDVLNGEDRHSLNQGGVFAECEDVEEVRNFNWPNPDYLNFDSVARGIEKAKEHNFAIASGMWMPFFHVACDFFGMDNYFVKMYTDPEVVDEVTSHIVDFYYEANKRFLERFADDIDIVFFGNDLGSQRDLLISPECFDRFVAPYMKRLVDQAKSYNKKVMIHSCGAIGKIIPKFIELGIDAVHPLQAKAEGMDAETIAKYKDDIIFVGGVDTQQLLPFGTPEQVVEEVRRLKEIWGQGFVVSPSHEALLPNVTIENFEAMCKTATE